ncbi:alpha/beta fold hydrolase [Phenylobacterium sp.]|uniref:alpha/beta fold hydrolase n=1 Tax=Phenylobacterium sp. TaxID=1871053 RepID=UPI00286C4E62|nr:alpha/beta fold hydrolase [Phenylobacterium sp.]
MTPVSQSKANISLVVEALYAIAAEPDRWDQIVEALGGASLDGAAKAEGAARLAGFASGRAEPAPAQAGVILIGPSGGAVAWNAGGAAVFQQRLGLIEARGLRFFNATNHEALDAARKRLREAAGRQVIVKFAQAHDEAPHFAYVIPARALPTALAADLPAVGELDEGAVAVLFPAVETTDRLWATMRDSFGLTPAETRLAAKLKDGLTLKEAADDLSISVNTVRNQLRAVFDKMGLNRQSELVRALTQLGSLSGAFGQGAAPTTAIAATERGALSASPPIRFFRLSDGRRLAWRDYGDPAGRPAIVMHQGLGCSILPRGSDVLARDLGLRLIAPERPGAGRSDPRPNFTFQGVGQDVAELSAGLGLGPVRVAAFMAGAPFALMAAAAMGAGVESLLLASARPSGQMMETERDAGHPGVLFRRRILRNAWLADTLFALMRLQLNRRQLERFVRAAASAPSDGAYLATHPEVMDFIVDYIGESLSVSSRGIADEIRCASKSPQLDLAGLTAPISVWHGADDPMTSVDQVTAWLGDRSAEVRTFQHTGHFLAHKHWPEVLGWLARD